MKKFIFLTFIFQIKYKKLNFNNLKSSDFVVVFSPTAKMKNYFLHKKKND